MDDLIHVIPEKWRGTALVTLAMLPYLTRSYHAIVSGGGLRGIWQAIWFGTNTPKDKA